MISNRINKIHNSISIKNKYKSISKLNLMFYIFLFVSSYSPQSEILFYSISSYIITFRVNNQKAFIFDINKSKSLKINNFLLLLLAFFN